MKVKKAVIPAAGLGTRFLPATKAQSKEMLSLVDRPLIQYAVEEAVASGIEKIVIVIRPGREGIQQHFAPARELELMLEQKGEQDKLKKVQRVTGLADISYTCQEKQLGLGHAVLMAKDFVGNEPFAVILPDDVIEARVPTISQLIEVYNKYNCSVLAVEQVERERLRGYGVIKPQKIDETVSKVLDMVEKPEPEQAPSNLGIVGRYLLTPDIFAMLERTLAGKGGEIQLTDGLRLLLEQQAIYSCSFSGVRYDTGTPLGFIKASVELAMRHPEIGAEFKSYLRSLKI